MVSLTVTRRGRRLLRAGFGLVAVLALAGGGWMWLRDSSLVRVSDVQITGVTASDGEQVKAALEGAALEMTTLHVREDVLREATANHPLGRRPAGEHRLPARDDDPGGRAPGRRGARPPKGERRIPVTGTGILLRGVTADRDLPSLIVKDDGRRAAAHRSARAASADDRRCRTFRTSSAAPNELQVNSRGVVVTLR